MAMNGKESPQVLTTSNQIEGSLPSISTGRGRTPATTCRYCGEGGELEKGAHYRCKYLATRKRKRQPGPCEKCAVNEKLQTSPLGLCRQCSDINKKESIRQANKRWHVRRKEAALGPPPACKCGCGKPVEDRRRRFYASKECMEKVANAKHVDKQRIRRAKAPKEPKKVVKALAPQKRAQERPHAEPKQSAPPKAEVIIVPPHITVTRIPPSPVFARGLRNLFGDESGNCWSAVD